MSKPFWIRAFAWFTWPALAAACASAFYVGTGHASAPLAFLTLGLFLTVPALWIIWALGSIWWRAQVSSAVMRAGVNRGSGPPVPPTRPARATPAPPGEVVYVSGGPHCMVCAAHFAVMECGTHKVKLCLACMAAHDTPSQCFYFPVTRPGSGESKEGEPSLSPREYPAPGAARGSK